MKKVVLLLLSIVALYGAAISQVDGSKVSAEKKEEWKAKMAEYQARLKLTPDQQDKFKEINEAYVKKLSEIRSDGGGRMAKLKKFKKANKEKDKQMKELLTAEQFQVYKEQQEVMKKEMKERRSNGY